MPPIAGYIYLVTNLVDGKVYVGLTKLIKKRWGEHLSAARNGSPYPLHRAIRKYGPQSFVVTCLETVITNREDLLAAEIRQIAAHDCTAPKGYNLTLGGEGVDFSVPGVRERHLAAMVLRSAAPTWHKATMVGIRKRSENFVWRKNVAEAALLRAADPVCQASLKEGCRKRSADPVYRANLLKANRKRSLDPKWIANTTAASQTKATDPVWRKAQKEGMQRVSSARLAKTAARDAHFSVEEQKRRARRRERDRQYQAARRKRELLGSV